MSKRLLVLNWKNYPNSLAEAKILLRDLAKKKLLYRKVSLFIAPPLPYLTVVGERFPLASQDLPKTLKGTYTGEVSLEILKSFGVRLSILGHSERRELGETTIEIKEKIKNALRTGITPLICFGEKIRDADGEHFEFLRQELKTLLNSFSKAEARKLMLAYEPIWAIGKSAKDSISGEELSETLVFIKKILSDLFGRRVADKIPILYGGSVEPANAESLIHTGVRGFLIGHASLNGKSVEEIVKSI